MHAHADFTLDDLEAALRLIRRHMAPTAQLCWPLLSRRAGAELWVKHENHTPVGAFKIRGGIVHLDALHRRHPTLPGIISATRGNHGQSLAWAGQRFGIGVTIVVPHANSAEKNAAMAAQGARLIEHGSDFEAARAEADRLAAEQGLRFVPSFAPDLVLGVATWAAEFFRNAPPLDVLYVPIGLGSGICGAIRVRDLLGLPTRIVGVQAEGAPAYARSLAAGRPITLNQAATEADGIAVRAPDAGALAIIAAGCERIVTVPDSAIAAAMRAYWTDTHNLAEGAGAAPLAAILQDRAAIAGKRVGAVLSGGNVDLALFRRWVMAATENA